MQQAEGESKRLRDDVRAGEETAELREEERVGVEALGSEAVTYCFVRIPGLFCTTER